MQKLLTWVDELTMHRKTMPHKIICLLRKYFAYCTISIVSTQLNVSCATVSNDVAVRSQSDKDAVQELVGAGKIIDCQIINQEWIIPGDIKHAALIRNKENSALVYQAFLRSGPRTVYQQLTPGFAFDGDGFVIGLKDAPNVLYFRAFQDLQKNLWTVSRVRMKDKDIYKGLVEANIGSETFRTVLPTPSNQSVLQIWPTLPILGGYMNVVVRTVTNDDSAGIDSDDTSSFYWYRVDAQNDSAKLMSRFSNRNVDVSPSGFLALERTGEPVAASIVRTASRLVAADSMASNEPAKVSLVRIFNKALQERVIFTGRGNISGLHVSNPIYPGVHLAWSFAPSRSANRYIQSTSFNVRYIPENFFSRQSFPQQEAIIATEVAYEANDPELLFTPTKGGYIPVLGWWGQLEQDVSVVLFPITKSFRKNATNILKGPDGQALGIGFTPSLAVVPPKPFRRVMSFKAAPSPIERNIIIFGNRDESSELKKESQLFPCAF